MASQKSMQQFSSEKDTTSKRSILVPWRLSYEFQVFLFRLSSSVPSWMIPLKMFVVCKRNISTLLIVHCITYYREVASTHGGWIPRWGEYLVVGMSGRVWVLRGWVPGVGMSRGEYSEVSIQGWVCSEWVSQGWVLRDGEYPRDEYKGVSIYSGEYLGWVCPGRSVPTGWVLRAWVVEWVFPGDEYLGVGMSRGGE